MLCDSPHLWLVCLAVIVLLLCIRLLRSFIPLQLNLVQSFCENNSIAFVCRNFIEWSQPLCVYWSAYCNVTFCFFWKKKSFIHFICYARNHLTCQIAQFVLFAPRTWCSQSIITILRYFKRFAPDFKSTFNYCRLHYGAAICSTRTSSLTHTAPNAIYDCDCNWIEKGSYEYRAKNNLKTPN